MTEPESVLLDRAQLERAFTDLGDRLVRRGTESILLKPPNRSAASFFRDEDLPPRAAAILQELFGSP